MRIEGDIMKLSIAVCEDQVIVNAMLEETLEDILKKLSIKCEIEIFYSGEKLCKRLEEGQNYNLIFLDIEYGDEKISGVDVGKLIRDTHQNNSVSIVYISWEKKYSLELHNLQPLNFLIKPLEYESIEKVMRKYLDIAGIWSSYFIYKIGYESHRKQIRDISYVESRDRKLILHLADGQQVEFYGALKQEFSEQLQKFDFLFIHAAFAVNYDYIVKYTRETVVMSPSGVTLSVSQGRRSEISKRFLYIANKREG